MHKFFSFFAFDFAMHILFEWELNSLASEPRALNLGI